MRKLFVMHLVFQLQLDGCEHEVMVAANVGPWEISCVSFVDAGDLKRWGVTMKSVWFELAQPTRGVPGCCPRQLVWVSR